MQGRMSSAAGADVVSTDQTLAKTEPQVVRMKNCLSDCLAALPPTKLHNSTFCTPPVILAFRFVLQ